MGRSKRFAVFLVHVLLLAAALQATNVVGQEELPVLEFHVEDYYVLVPGEFAGSGELLVLVGGSPVYKVGVDLDWNSTIDPGESAAQSIAGVDLSYTLFRVYSPGVDSLIHLIVNTTTTASVMVLFKSPDTDMAAAYKVTPPSTILYAPPLEGRLLIGNPWTYPANVTVGGDEYIVPPHGVVETCKPSNVTVIVSTIPVVGLLYGYEPQEGIAWATELVPGESTAPGEIGYSLLQARYPGASKVEAYAVYANGTYTAYSVERAAVSIAIERPRALFYSVAGEGFYGVTAVYEDVVPEEAFTGITAYTGGGLILPGVVAAFPVGSTDYMILGDVDGDGSPEFIHFGDASGVPYVVPANHTIILLTGGPSPLLGEYGPGALALYSFALPSTAPYTPESFYYSLDGEEWVLGLGREGGDVLVYFEVTPRVTGGGVRNAALALFTPSLEPLQGSFTKMNATGDSLVAGLRYPANMLDEGFYTIALIVYQATTGILTSFRSTDPLTQYTPLERPSQPPVGDCSPHTGEYSIYNVSVVGEGFIDHPSLEDLDLVGLADLLIAAATSPPTTATNTTTATNATTTTTPTSGEFEEITPAPGTSGGEKTGGAPALLPFIASGIAIVLAALYLYMKAR